MKFTSTAFAGLMLIVTGCTSIAPEERWKATLSALQEADEIDVDIEMVFNQFGTTQTDTAIFHLSRDTSDAVLGWTYYNEIPNYITEIYNGKEWITAVYDEGLVLVEPAPGVELLQSSGTLMTSPLYIRHLLEKVASGDIAITYEGDTTAWGEEHDMFRFDLQKQWVSIDGKINPTEGALNTFDLWIATGNNLPSYFLVTIADNNGSVATRLSNYTFGEKLAAEKWQQESLSPDLNKMNLRSYYAAAAAKMSITAGSPMPPFSLIADGNSVLNNAALQGKTALLVFWFPGCGPCIEAVPFLNQLYQTYSPKGLVMYGLDISNSPEENIQAYVGKYQVAYPVVPQAKVVSEQFGITSAPTLVLVGSNGLITEIFRGVDNDAVLGAVKRALQ